MEANESLHLELADTPVRQDAGRLYRAVLRRLLLYLRANSQRPIWRGCAVQAVGEEMSISDPVDVHRALQKAAREFAHHADHGSYPEYLAAIDNLEEKLQAVRSLIEWSRSSVVPPDFKEPEPDPMERMQEMLGDIHRSVGRAIEVANGSPLTIAEKYNIKGWK
jgi:hypothetical protein